MGNARTICITLPRPDGGRWVFIDPPLPELAFQRDFATADEAEAYAQQLAGTTGWPVEDALLLPTADVSPERFDERQARINELLWLMTTIVHEGALDWDDPSFWADAARQQAQVIFNAGAAMANEDLAVMLAIGGAMLRLAAERIGLDSIDDVLASIMVVRSAT